MKSDTARRLRRNRIGMLIGMGLMLLAALGEALGWWRDWGIVLGALGVIATLWFGFSGPDAVLARLEETSERQADDLATVKVVLERIERLLTERLPPPTR
jgi:hypothetical protein